MPGSLQNKLQQFEVAPPASAWNRISEQLDAEFVPGDTDLSSALENVSIDPPQTAWANIAAGLYGEPVQERSTGKVIPVIFKRIAVAALLAGLAFIGVYYFMGPKDKQQPGPVAYVQPKTRSLPPNRPVTADPLPQTNSGIETISPVAAVPRKNNVRESRSVPLAQAPLYELNTVSAFDPVSVTAPPLRDKAGNLILDIATISKPDEPYITVTGPNGKQTKISSKFLSCLGYINNNLSSTDTDLQAIQCTMQFEEWRRKLLSEPAFIPTANNFFDIFELKDLLQEM